MGDISNEPSMEDILSSIKRIIAEEGEAATGTRATRRPPRAPAREIADEILELSDPAPEPQIQAAPQPAPVAAEPAPAAPIVSPAAVEATRGPLEALSKLIVKPDVAGADTLEGLVRELLRPMLSEWLDANLPQIVESMVAREISRITGRPD